MTGLTVVKVGGHELEDAAWVGALAGAVASSAASTGSPLVLVHGGGREVTALQERLGLAAEWRNGLRVTDDAGLAVVAMVLTGLINKRLVSALVGAGLGAAGISGEDDGLLRAEPAAGGALGRVGEVVEVRPSLLRLLLDAGLIPVVSPLSRGPDGGALNVNADDAAVAVAGALGADRLLFVSNVPGVLGAEGVAAELPTSAVESSIAAGAVTGGMAPKLRAAARAVAGGVADVRIGGLDLLAGGAGTRVVASRERAA